MKIILALDRLINKNLLFLLLLTYINATFFPSFGEKVVNYNLGEFSWSHLGSLNLSMSLLLVSIILFNAGFSIRWNELKHLLLKPRSLIIGALLNTAVPFLLVSFVGGIVYLFFFEFDKIHNIIMSLGIICSMPIAGSATTWVQNTQGNMPFILGLVIFSTLTSPLFSPSVFHFLATLLPEGYSGSLEALAHTGARGMLIGAVLFPSFLGVLFRNILKEDLCLHIKPLMKILSTLSLLLVIYSNATKTLPGFFQSPDYSFLIVTVASVTFFSITSFALGWLLPKLFRFPNEQRVAFMFGLGMYNNATGMVLASIGLKEYPLVMLPIIFYSVAQHIIAGTFNLWALKQQTVKKTHSPS